MPKHSSTHFLRFTLLFLALAVLALCIFFLPFLAKGSSTQFPVASLSILLIVIGLYFTVIPFFVALWQAWSLLKSIDEQTAFSEASVHAIRMIKRCAVVIAVIYVGFIPLLFPIADADDAPGLLLMGAVLSIAPMVVAVFAAVLERLLQSAIELKVENELTV